MSETPDQRNITVEGGEEKGNDQQQNYGSFSAGT